jgi:ribosomal protein L20
MHGLKQAKVALDRKVLSDLAIADAAAFTKIVKTASPK